MERSIVARDHVVDHMKTYNLRPFCIDINTDLYMLVKGAAAKYKAYLEKNRKKKIAATERENQKSISTNNMVKLKNECDAVKRATEIMEKDITKHDITRILNRLIIYCERKCFKKTM